MKKIGVLLPHDYKLLSAASILDVFETVNTIYTSNRKELPFHIQLVQTTEQINKSGKKFHNYQIKSLQSREKMDLILIPSFTTTSIAQSLERNKAYLPWLKQQFREGAEIASFCTGALLFAASGLLNGKLATTHVDACANFVVSNPLVFVKPGRTLTVDGRCYTSGGGNSSFHLLVFLIQKYCSQDVAVRISKIFSIELDRHQQSYFSTFRPDYSHNDVLIKKIQKKLENGYLSIQTIEEVTKDLPASRRNMVRRFKQATGIPPIEYLQNIRVETSKKLLEQTDLNISEIISQTGYADPKSFRKIFLKLVGISPLEYREKFKVK